MGKERTTQALALQGGMKAVSAIEGRGEPKIGIPEFLSVAERFGFSQRALRRMRAVLRDEALRAGPFLANYYSGLRESKVQAFERVAREVFGAKHSIGTSSGTGALHAAFVAVGVGPGTEVICPAVGFFATAAAVVAAKGVPVFCDVDESLAIDPAKLEALITPRTVAVAPTHVMGGVCDMAPILRVARARGLRVVEDCAQSCGARYRGAPVGTLGDMGCFSISAYKTIGGGEGGLVLTNDRRLWERASQAVECGGLWRPDRFAPPRYRSELFCGTNYRMSELEAAIDVVQLRKIAAVNRRFSAVRRRILERLETYREIQPQKINDLEGEVGYLLRFFPATRALSEKVARALNAEGVACTTRGRSTAPDWHQYSFMYPLAAQAAAAGGDCPFSCERYRRRGGRPPRYGRGACPTADDLFDRVVNVQLNQWYTARDCRAIAEGINKVLSAYCARDPHGAPWLPAGRRPSR